jgi:hypothetical protein
LTISSATLTDLATKVQDSLRELSCDSSLKIVFTQKHFLLHAHSEYPELSDKAVKYLMPFPTTYIYESGFLALIALKSKYQNKMDAEPDHSNRTSDQWKLQNSTSHFTDLV